MTTRSRVAIVGCVFVIVAAFFFLWIRSLERSWNEARVMPLFGDEKGRYERVMDETKNVFGEFTETWQRATTPPTIETHTSTNNATLPPGAAERIEEGLRSEQVSP